MVKQRKNMSFFCLGMLCIFLLSNISWAESGEIILSSKPDSNIRIDGNNAVWMSYSNGNWDIYHLDMATGVETRITNDINTQSFPDVWGKYIVWQDNRNHINDDIKFSDIYLYDMETKTETKISQLEGDHREPIIKNNMVVWVDHKYGNKDVMLYDIEKKTLEKVSSDDAQAFGVAFDGSIIAWMDCRDGDFDIYIYNIANKTEQRITYGLGDELDPIVDNGRVVWMVEHNGYSQVYMYDTQSDFKTKLTVGQENHRPIAFSGDSVLIEENDKLALNNVDNITEQSINSPTGKIPNQAFINGDKVVWFDGVGLTEESVDSALNRDDDDIKPNPLPGDTGGSSTTVNNSNLKDNKTLIKANKDTIVKSDDGILTLKFPKGSFETDTYITLVQDDKFYKEGYKSISPIYRWQIDGDKQSLLPIEIAANYSSIKADENVKKICLYSLDESNSLNLVSSKANHEGNTLISNVKKERNIVLMVYNKEFIDMKNHWAQETVEIIAAHHIIDGYKDQTFKPSEEMTRAEFVKILVSSMCDSEEIMKNMNAAAFDDVSPDFWAASYISIASERGWVSGHNGKFNPNQPITREQMVTILMRVYEDISIETTDEEAIDVSVSSYNDKDKISKWAYDSMEQAVIKGIIQGNNGEISPLRNATRAEAATILYRYLEKLQRL